MAKLGVITDGISRDLEHALQVMTEAGLEYAELQFVWDKEVGDFNDDEMARALDLDLAGSGLLVSFLALGLGVGVVAGGPLVDRFPRRPAFVGAMLLAGVPLLCAGPDLELSIWLPWIDPQAVIPSHRATVDHDALVRIGVGGVIDVLMRIDKPLDKEIGELTGKQQAVTGSPVRVSNDRLTEEVRDVAPGEVGLRHVTEHVLIG